MPVSITAHDKYSTYTFLSSFCFCFILLYWRIELLSFIDKRNPKSHFFPTWRLCPPKSQIKGNPERMMCFVQDHTVIFGKSTQNPELPSLFNMICWLPASSPLSGQTPSQPNTHTYLSNSPSFVVYRNGEKWRHWCVPKHHILQLYGMIAFM